MTTETQKQNLCAPVPPCENALGFDDVLTFGAQWRGWKMKEVPAEYYYWIWDVLDFRAKENPLADYIRTNLEVMKTEFPKGDWDGYRTKIHPDKCGAGSHEVEVDNCDIPGEA